MMKLVQVFMACARGASGDVGESMPVGESRIGCCALCFGDRITLALGGVELVIGWSINS